MRLYRLQSSPENFLVAKRSSHSPLPSTWATFVVERIRSECWPSLTWASVNVISPAPVKDQLLRSSMLSSARESSTFLFSHRDSAPSSYFACIGISGTVCCARGIAAKQKILRAVLIKNRPALFTCVLLTLIARCSCRNRNGIIYLKYM